MTKTIRNTFITLALALSMLLPFMFAGCNEKEIEDYKAQIDTLQQQVNTIHTPTAEERAACGMINKTVQILKSDTSSNSNEINHMGSRIEDVFNQFYGVEFNKILNVKYTDSQTTNYVKLAVNLTSNSIQLKSGKTGNYYEFITINFDPLLEKPTSVKSEWYSKNDNSFYVEIQTYVFGDNITITQNQYNNEEDAEFIAVKQQVQAFDALKTNLDVDGIL